MEDLSRQLAKEAERLTKERDRIQQRINYINEFYQKMAVEKPATVHVTVRERPHRRPRVRRREKLDQAFPPAYRDLSARDRIIKILKEGVKKSVFHIRDVAQALATETRLKTGTSVPGADQLRLEKWTGNALLKNRDVAKKRSVRRDGFYVNLAYRPEKNTEQK